MDPSAYTEGLRKKLALLESIRGDTPGASERAMAPVSRMAGTMILARVIDDESLSERLLRSAKQAGLKLASQSIEP